MTEVRLNVRLDIMSWRTHSVSFREADRFIVYGEMIAVYCQNRIKQKHILSERKAEIDGSCGKW